jgi:hypothetical protein
MKFVPAYGNIQQIMKEEWIGYIKIEPPLAKEESDYLCSYLSTWHFNEPKEEFNGLYGVHSNRELEANVSIDNSSNKTTLIKKNKQPLVPSLIAPIVLGYVNNSKEVNALGIRASYKSSFAAPVWFSFLIEHFFKTDSIAKHLFYEAFINFYDHTLNGEIIYKNHQGSITNISISQNKVTTYDIGIPMTLYGKAPYVNKPSKTVHVHNKHLKDIFYYTSLGLDINRDKIFAHVKNTSLHTINQTPKQFKRLSKEQEVKWMGDEMFMRSFEGFLMNNHIKEDFVFNNKSLNNEKVIKF